MTARILPGDDPAAIEEAAAALRGGRMVAFPTETVYGLGANALDPIAVARIFEAKGRPRFDPLIVHLADAADAGRYAEAADVGDPRVGRLAARFWPGPLTIVLGKRDLVPGIVTAGLETVGIRVPDHPVALRLIGAAAVPIAAPSANRFGGLSPTRAEHVARQLGARIDLILDGGACRVGVESTVILLAGGRALLLRPGGLPIEAIESEIGPLDKVALKTDRGPARAPGRLLRHYAPGVPLEIVAPEAPLEIAPGERVGLLAASEAGRRRAEASGPRFKVIQVPAPDGDLLVLAAGLFEALNRLDASGLDRIVAQPVAEDGLGRAIMDRLRRAAATWTPGPPQGKR